MAGIWPAVTLRAVDARAAEIEPTVRAAQSGDLTAFARIYREHVGRVYALCVRLSADRVFAEQLTQDTFVRAWERIATYRGESSFAACCDVSPSRGDGGAPRRLVCVASAPSDASKSSFPPTSAPS